MKTRIGLMLVLAGALAALPPPAAAADTPAEPAASTAHKGAYTDAQLDQMLAPIALYPDQLLSQVLMASTYPLEVVEAARWVRKADNAALSGDALANALKSEPWAPSVKSLVPFPQVLHMMDDHLNWTEQLGDAFLADEKAVMASVQRLRKQAVEAGNLKSTQYANVENEGSQIVIVPAVTNYVYVPVYDPFYVYGPWPYPAYPPYYFTGYFNVALVGGWGWFGFSIVQPLWGWSSLNWVAYSVYVNPTRYDTLNVYGPPLRGNRWRHNPYHRRGVPYPSANLRERYRAPGGAGELRRFRGYPMAPPPATPAGAAAGVFGGSRATVPSVPSGRSAPSGAPRQREVQRQQREVNRFREREQFQAPRTSPAFESFGRSGTDIRTQSQRGFSSRQSAPGGAFTRERGNFGGQGSFQGGGGGSFERSRGGGRGRR